MKTKGPLPGETHTTHRFFAAFEVLLLYLKPDHVDPNDNTATEDYDLKRKTLFARMISLDLRAWQDMLQKDEPIEVHVRQCRYFVFYSEFLSGYKEYFVLEHSDQNPDRERNK